MKNVKSAKTTEPKAITSLAELEALLNEPMYCEFSLSGRPVKLELKRLSTDVNEQVRNIQRAAPQPPWNKERNDYDYMNPLYLQKRDLQTAIARSFVIYTGCPEIARKKPGLTKPEDIHAFVKTLLIENIQETIFLTLAASGMEKVVERSNFTSTGALEG